MKLIVFFNGWGMDNKAVDHLIIPKNYEVKIVNFPYDLDSSIFKNYEDIIAIGWSFGSYYLCKYLNYNNIKLDKVISINGVPETIGEFGIPERIFEATLKNLTPETLKEFYHNMGVDSENLFSNRNFQEIKAELQYFKDNYSLEKNVFTKAFIGKKDRIIPALRQEKYYNSHNIEISIIQCPHYPFNFFKSWLDIIGEN
ncbi:MAG: pimeloyl-ACP methyl esterase BioG family protein [Fusobacterium sp.]|uniref:pimeloyl-ACP methyl esterase BioG family protein n=1 Tax=Fusobacterium sp. TaxID=68766 RepID=UPI0025F3D969|nr:pimeloyl-ACP methyl esterase BioG family protein [uncultured Fusobacterium sp.]